MSKAEHTNPRPEEIEAGIGWTDETSSDVKAHPQQITAEPSTQDISPNGHEAHVTAVLREALWWVEQGCAVLPLKPGTKAPLFKGWNDPESDNPATTNEATIRRWFERHPDRGLAVALKPSKLVSVAPDSVEWLERFKARGGLDTPWVIASGGGEGHEHWLFRTPDGCPTVRDCVSGEYDVLADGFIVVPPSIHPKTGKPYRWQRRDAKPLSVAPEWAVEMLVERANRPTVDDVEIDHSEPPVRLTEAELARWNERPGEGEGRWRWLADNAESLARHGLKGRAIYDELRRLDLSLPVPKFAGRNDDVELRKLVGRALSQVVDVDLSALAPAERPRGVIRNLRDVMDDPDPEFLIDGFVPERSLTILYGDPGCGKTFAALDMSLSVAFGIDWQGFRLVQGPVLYVAAEGAGGIKKRTEAWLRANGDRLPEGSTLPDCFWLFGQPLPLAKDRPRRALVEQIRALPDAPKLIVLDTVSKLIAGSNENLQQDVGAFLDAADELKREFGAAILMIHHTNKSGGMRGSSVFPGDVDVTIEAARVGDGLELSSEKMKEDDEFRPLYLERHRVELDGVTRFGKQRASLVFVRAERPTPFTQDGIALPRTPTKLSGHDRRALDVLLELQPGAWLRANEWYRACGLDGNPAGQKRTRMTLLNAGLVRNDAGPGYSKWQATARNPEPGTIDITIDSTIDSTPEALSRGTIALSTSLDVDSTDSTRRSPKAGWKPEPSPDPFAQSVEKESA